MFRSDIPKVLDKIEQKRHAKAGKHKRADK